MPNGNGNGNGRPWKKNGHGNGNGNGNGQPSYANMGACVKGERKKNPKVAVPALMKSCAKMLKGNGGGNGNGKKGGNGNGDF